MFQRDLSYAVGQIGNYIVTNGGLSAAELEELQAQQTEGVAEEAVCKSDWADTYLKMAAENDIGATEIRRDTDKLVSQPGKPTWGTCV